MAITAIAIGSSMAATAAFAAVDFALMGIIGMEVAGVAIAGIAAVGAAYAVNTIAQAVGIVPKPDTNTGAAMAQGLTTNTQSPVAAIPVIYGTRLVGGNFVYIGSSGADNAYLHLVMVIGEGVIKQVGAVYFNDSKVLDMAATASGTRHSTAADTEYTGILGMFMGAIGDFIQQISPADAVDIKYTGLVDITWHSGEDDQLADSDAINEIPGWTTDHRLRGTAYLYIRLKYDRDAFATGLPTITANIAGRTIYDPRTGLTAHSNNPALVLRDYLTHQRYGRGLPASAINDATFSSAANYCDQAVTLGGVQVARYTANGVVSAESNSLDVARAMLTACRGMLIFSAGAYKLIIDKPEVPVAAFDEDNIVGAWTISMGDKSSRFNRIRAGFFNSASLWSADIATAESATLRTADNGLILERQFDLPFTSTAERALMIATMNLNQSRQQVAAEFTATIAGMRAEVGDVVYVKHSTPGWDTLNGGAGKAFRVLKIALKNDDEVRVSVIEYDATVYDYGTIAAIDATPNTALPNPRIVGVPGDLQVAESLYQTTGSAGVKTRATISWTAPADAFVADYQVGYKLRASSTWTEAFDIRGLQYPFDDLAPGDYDFRVRARNTLGATSAYTPTKQGTLYGLTAAPANVSGFSIKVMNGLALATWDRTTDLDVKIGGDVVIRWSPLSTGATWDASVILPDGEMNGDASSAIVPLAEGTYFAKFIDSTGHYSNTAASFVATEALVTGWTTIATATEHTAFTGAKTNITLSGGEIKLTVDANNLVTPVGTYEFTSTMDLTTIAARRFHAHIKAGSLYAGPFVDALGSVDDWQDVDGGAINDTTATVYASLSDNNVTYSAWTPFLVADFSGRYAKFKAMLSSGDVAHNIAVSQLSVSVKTPV